MANDSETAEILVRATKENKKEEAKPFVQVMRSTHHLESHVPVQTKRLSLIQQMTCILPATPHMPLFYFWKQASTVALCESLIKMRLSLKQTTISILRVLSDGKSIKTGEGGTSVERRGNSGRQFWISHRLW